MSPHSFTFSSVTETLSSAVILSVEAMTWLHRRQRPAATIFHNDFS